MHSEISYGDKVQELIYQDRKGEIINKDMIKSFVQLYVDLGKDDNNLKPMRTNEGEIYWKGK